MRFDRWNLMIIFVYVMWGTMHPPLKILSDALPPLVINLLRFSIALAVLAPLALWQKTVPTRRDFWRIALLGMVGIAVYGIIAVAGLHRSTAVNSSILLNTHPVLAAILAPIFLKEKITWQGMAGVLVGFFGVLVVVTNGFQVGGLGEKQYFFGNLLLLLSAGCLAFYAMYSKALIPRYGSLTTTFYAVLAGVVALAVLTLASEDLGVLSTLSLKQLGLIAYIAIMTTAIGWVVWFLAIQKIGVIRAEILFFLAPVSGVISSAIVLGERISGSALLGAGCILIGIFGVQRSHTQP